MPQEFYVLKCFSCETYQVHIVKKGKKWECKMCGAKQSLKRNYGKGSAKDCRTHCMKLNELRILGKNVPNQIEDELLNNKQLINELMDDEMLTEVIKVNPEKKPPTKSKWIKYLDERKSSSEEEEGEEVAEEVLDNHFFNQFYGKKRKRNTKKSFNIKNELNKKLCKSDYAFESKVSIKLIDDPDESPTLINNDIDKSEKENKEMNFSSSVMVSKSTDISKQSKYSKYLDGDESKSKNDLSRNIKCSNIFQSDTDDLDDILDF